tara:strand:- start:168 stop:527 length:360 start_codon:yes stop_codon:yes gene_type:complete
MFRTVSYEKIIYRGRRSLGLSIVERIEPQIDLSFEIEGMFSRAHDRPLRVRAYGQSAFSFSGSVVEHECFPSRSRHATSKTFDFTAVGYSIARRGSHEGPNDLIVQSAGHFCVRNMSVI